MATRHQYQLYASALLPLAALLSGCSPDTPVVSLGINDSYRVERLRKLPLKPALTGEKYLWKINGEPAATTREFIFLKAEEGVYDVSFDIIDPDTPVHFDFKVTVLHEEVEYSPYISRVYEYCPAPGQFVNEMPRYEEGDTAGDMAQKAEDCISGTNDEMISLGAYGGYVTFGFDHTIISRAVPELRIWGNTFYELTDPTRPGGSAEPGIVMVSFDSNCNGLPDDEWYELAGSEYDAPGTLHGYSITYHRPDPDREIKSDGHITDSDYIAWEDSHGGSGFISKVRFHAQDYFPKWISGDQLTFSGSLLLPNAIDKSGDGSYFVLYSYPWGYADNHPNDYPGLNSFHSANARDSKGNPVALPGIDFVRVYTEVNQQCGWLGETSTEICRAADISLLPDNKK